MIEIFKLSLSDFFSKKFLFLSILPLFISLTILGFGIFGALGGAKEAILAFLSGYELTQTLATSEIFEWILGGFLYVAAAYFGSMASLFLAILISGFLTPIITKEINKRHYQISLNDPPTTALVLKKMGAAGAKFVLLMLFCLPLLFVPLLGFFVPALPLFYLYYKFLSIDIYANTLNKDEFLLRENGLDFKFALCCFVFYLLYIMPLLGLLLQPFIVTFLSHLVFKFKTKI